MPEIEAAKKEEMTSKFREFLEAKYKKDIVKAAEEERALVIGFKQLAKRDPELGEYLVNWPDPFFEVVETAVNQMDLPGPVKVRFSELPDLISIRDLRSEHVGKFLCTEGIVRKSSEIRPEITAIYWECPSCKDRIKTERVSATYIPKPLKCDCGNTKGFKQADKDMIDTRWIVIEEPFELTEGERPSQVTILLTEDLVSPDGRRITDPGNRLRMTGVLRDIPKGKSWSVKLDFFLDANHCEPTEIGWESVQITKKDEEEIKKLAKDPKVYDKLVDSLAPSLYGMREIKESIIMQLFGGVRTTLKDKLNFRGDIHILLVGDPASGKCVTGDTRVLLRSGELRPIRDVVEKKLLDNRSPINDGFYARGNDDLLSLGLDGKTLPTKANIFWKRRSPKNLFQVETCSGKKITVTPTHPFFVCSGGLVVSKKASQLKKNDFIAAAQRIPVNGEPQKIKIKIERSPANAAKHIKVPDRTSPELCRFLAYLLAEGYLQKTRTSCLVWFTNNDPHLLRDFEACSGIFGIPLHKRRSHKGKTAWDFYLSSIELGRFLQKIEPSLFKKSRLKRVPDIIMRASNPEIRAFLQVFFDCEAHVEQRGIELSGASRELLEQLQAMLLRFGINSQLHTMSKRATNSPRPRFRTYYRLAITGSDVQRFGKEIGLSIARKKSRPQQAGRKNSISNTLPGLAETLLTMRKRLRLIQFEAGCIRTTYQHLERGDRNPMPRTLGRVLRTFERRLQELGQLKAAVQRADWAGLKAIRSQLHISQAELAKRAGASQSLISQYELGKCGKRKSNKILEKLRKALYDACTSILGDDWLKARMKALRTLLDSDIFWDRIKNVQKMPSNQKWVYDLQVPGVHNFLANQIFVHNSQLMKLVPNLVPRGRYVSGKGVTTAGLTATVTKDEQFMGGWVLEAGAIVLANKGLLSVDEFEKMSPDDQVAMHEALEQGSVSIAKASIVTTLPAQTSVLAGGNPKFSRFDPYQPISKQITIPDTLLSRFDLKFVLRDQPNPEEDQKIVDHILGSREEDHTASIPKMPSDFIRKYVAYAKEHCQPVHTKETGKILKTFYVESRRKALKEGAPVPITLRQFEALMRLSEASAKIQLSPLVRKEDAKRAIKLMKFSLRQLGYDPETGLIDVDKAEGLTTASERSHIRAVLDIIELLSQKKKEIKIDEIEEAAKKEGVPNPSEIVDRLKREGMLFEPSPGHVQKV